MVEPSREITSSASNPGSTEQTSSAKLRRSDGRNLPSEEPAGQETGAWAAYREARRQVRLERAIEAAECRRRAGAERLLMAATAPDPAGYETGAAEILPPPVEGESGCGAVDSPASPVGCQWLAGCGPFTDADKCGAPATPGRSYCPHHLARATLPPTPKVEPEAGAG